MQYFTILSAFTALAAAAPTSTTNNTLEERGKHFSANINFFERWDCKDDCVENGFCLSGQANRGTKGSNRNWEGWDDGCWDRPAGVHSLAISVSNGHKFTGISKSCARWKKDNFAADTFPLKSGKKDQCNVIPGNKIKAVVYSWV